MSKRRGRTLLTAVFTGQGPLSPYLRDEKRVEEIFHILAGEERKDFVYAMKWKNETVSFAEIERLKEENHFVGSVLKELEAFTNMDGVLRTIWTSPVARNSIESFTEEEKKEIQKEAENIILEQLFQQERDKNENGKTPYLWVRKIRKCGNGSVNADGVIR